MQTGANELETVLMLANRDPAYMPDLCRVLLKSTVFALGDTNKPLEHNREVSLTNDNLRLIQWTNEHGFASVPFFSSLGAVKTVVADAEQCFSIPAELLFVLAKGQNLVLNPGLRSQQQFTAEQIESILSTGSFVTPIKVPLKPGKAALGQPAVYPVELIDGLKRFLPSLRNVKAAYLAQMADISSGEKPHLLIGLVGGDEVDIQQVSSAAYGYIAKGEFIDIVFVRPNDRTFGQYFLNETKPFYMRST